MRLHGVLSFLFVVAFTAVSSEDTPTISTTTTTTTAAATSDNATAELDLVSLEQLLGLPLVPVLDTEAEGVPENLTGFNAQSPLDLVMNVNNAEADVFHPLSTQHKDVKSLVDTFMNVYQPEIDVTNLNAEVLHVLKAERTAARPELATQSFGLGIDLVEEEIARQFRIFILVNYRFKSAMFAAKRPYVTALRVVMDCANTTAPSGEIELACDILEHIDLPRVNESTAAVPAYIQREIALAAPPSAMLTENSKDTSKNKKNHSQSVYYDALESQDLLYDTVGLPVHGAETVKYVRFRVSESSSAPDCMVVVQHAKGISTLLYSDSACYDGLTADSSTVMSAYEYTKENYQTFVLIAAFAGIVTAMLVLYRRRSRQRSGYSYLHSKTGNLSRLPSQNKSSKTSVLNDSTVPAIAS